jgi:hypothetical protein
MVPGGADGSSDQRKGRSRPIGRLDVHDVLIDVCCPAGAVDYRTRVIHDRMWFGQ